MKNSNIMIVCFVIVLVSMLSLNFISAADYYVESTYQGEENGTEVAPYKKIETAIANSTHGDRIHLNGEFNASAITMNKNLTIQGKDNSYAIINGNNSKHMFTINSGIRVTFINIIFKNGYGGSIINHGTVTMNNCNITNSSRNNGGSIYNSGSFTITNSNILNSRSSGVGGAIYNSGSLSITNSNIGGSANSNGGGIYNTGMLTLSNSTISNSYANNGGGIYNTGTINMYSTYVNSNEVNSNGGGIYNRNIVNIYSNSNIRWNQAIINGGGIYNTGRLTVSNSKVERNNANNAGGIYTSNYAYLSNCVLGTNMAEFNGGAIYNTKDLTILSSTIRYNMFSDTGGAVYNAKTGVMNISNSLFEDNSDLIIVNKGKFLNKNNIIKISKTYTRLRVTKLTQYYMYSDYIVFKLTDTLGNSISQETLYVTIKGKTYKIKTRNGLAHLLIKLKPGKYKIVCQYKGTSRLHGTSFTKTIRVKKTRTSIRTSSKIARRGNIITYGLQLKNKKNKALSKQTVIVKVNGRTFVRKTNSKGKIKIKFRIYKKGNHKIIMTYKGNKYNSKTVSKKRILVV